MSAELHYALRGLLVRGVVEAVDDRGPEQVLTVQGPYGQLRSAVPVLQPFGFSSHAPLDGAVCHLLQTGGDPADLVALPPANPAAARLGGIAEGESVLYDSVGQRVWLQGGRIVRIDTVGALQVTVGGTQVLTVTETGVAITGDLTVSGKIEAQEDVTAGGVSLEQHVHGGVQGGSGTSGTPQK